LFEAYLFLVDDPLSLIFAILLTVLFEGVLIVGGGYPMFLYGELLN
jgi:hypothetical protein